MYVYTTLYNIYIYIHTCIYTADVCTHVSLQSMTQYIWLLFNKNEPMQCTLFFSVDIYYRHLFILYRFTSFSEILFIRMYFIYLSPHQWTFGFFQTFDIHILDAITSLTLKSAAFVQIPDSPYLVTCSKLLKLCASVSWYIIWE